LPRDFFARQGKKRRNTLCISSFLTLYGGKRSGKMRVWNEPGVTLTFTPKLVLPLPPGGTRHPMMFELTFKA
jgi:hypothetical protein